MFGQHVAMIRATGARFPELTNLRETALFEAAVRRAEGQIARGGALAVRTGMHTGRSPRDKYIVEDDATRDHVWWEANQRMTPETFALLTADFAKSVAGRALYTQDLAIGAEPGKQLRVRVITELAWHALFARNLFIKPEEDAGTATPDLTIIDLPSFKADPERHAVRSETVIACDFQHGLVLIGGTAYAGEIKKAAFTFLNFRLPADGILPMHCSANIGPAGDTTLFFGLSGTGKTTLSADPGRTLIGDDEHGWSEAGIFNFEGGCYAKTISLSAQAEPDIHAACGRFGTVLENVVIDPATRQADFDDASLTENGRAAYPLEAIANASRSGLGAHPRNVVLLVADAFGVMPPLARLTPAQTIYHFLSGYTAKVAGTERGVTEPTATFSTCFGAPFMPRRPTEYGALLERLIGHHDVTCWLVNTGWTGGPFGIGRRMPLPVTRRLLSAALDGDLRNAHFESDAAFGLSVPTAVEGIDAKLLRPRSTWSIGAAYDQQAAKLAGMFDRNFEKFEKSVSGDIRAAGPRVTVTPA